MLDIVTAIITQSITFIPLAIGISTSYHILRATDMTIDGSFVLGAGVFAKCVTLGINPYLALLAALASGALAGTMVALMQRHGKIDALLAGVLATFILSSLNLIIMGKPNINLLSQTTLVSSAFASQELFGWLLVLAYVMVFASAAFFILRSRYGLALRAFGDNAIQLKRLGYNVEKYRIAGFAFTNTLAAASGCFTAQTVGYADIGMGLGMTLTGIGAIIIGHQVLQKIKSSAFFRTGNEFIACVLGVTLYFSMMNVLLRLSIDPLYLKMILGLFLIACLRAATHHQPVRG